MIMIPYAGNVIVFTLLVWIGSTAGGAIGAVPFLLILNLFQDAKKQAPAQNASNFGYSIGATICPILVTAIGVSKDTVQHSYLVLAILACILGVFTVLVGSPH